MNAAQMLLKQNAADADGAAHAAVRAPAAADLGHDEYPWDGGACREREREREGEGEGEGERDGERRGSGRGTRNSG